MTFCYWTILDSVILCIPYKSAWSKSYYRYYKVCFLPWPLPWNRQPGKEKQFCDNRDDFTYPIVNFPFISSNISEWVYIWRLITLFREQRLYKKGYFAFSLNTLLQKIYFRNHELVLVNHYVIFSSSHKTKWSLAFYTDKWNV